MQHHEKCIKCGRQIRTRALLEMSCYKFMQKLRSASKEEWLYKRHVPQVRYSRWVDWEAQGS